MIRNFNVRKIASILFVFVLAYLVLGAGFHVAWENALDTCREARVAQGEFVEPEVFGGVLAMSFNVTYWPVYSWANLRHFGVPFATPCDH